LDFLTPDSTDPIERETLQLEWEDQHFSPEHFLADWAEEDEIISPLINAPPPWQSEESHGKKNCSNVNTIRIKISNLQY
jgi:hypothetical protein